MAEKIQVNPLPVLTWNKLNLNGSELDVSGIAGSDALTVPSLPEGVSFAGTLDHAALTEWYAVHGVAYEPESIVAGKYPMASQDGLMSGMGKDAEELFSAAGTALYEIEGKSRKLRFNINAGAEIAAAAGLIFVKAGGEAELSFLIKAGSPTGFLGLRLLIVLEAGAKLKLSLLQRLPEAYVFALDLGAALAESAELEYAALQLGSGKVYTGAYFEQKGRASKLRSDLGFLALKDHSIDINYVDCFRGRDTEGVMRFSGVLCGNADKLSRETLDFRAGCRGASGDEEEELLVLGEDAVNKTIPMILGEEEDVSGRHAASSGRLSSDMLFYMQSRGMSEKTAEELMLRSRIGRVSGRFSDAELVKETEEVLDTLLGMSL